MRRLALLGTLLPLALLIGCGGDDDGDGDASSGGGEGAIEVVAEDIGFDAESYEAAPGSLTVAYRNSGAILHTLLIDEVDGFELEVASNGDEDEGPVDLEAGTYTLYCDVPGHREAGMEATLEIR